MVSHQKPLVGQWDKRHRAVVFIHGVGEQERGDTLMNFVSPIVDWMEKRGTDRPRLESYPRQGGERAYVRITLGNHRFELTEALWATTFKPLPNDLIIRWVARFIFLMVSRYWWHLFRDILLHPNKRSIGWWHIPVEVAHSALLILLFPLALPLVWLLIGLLWLVDTIPLPNILPNAVASALKGVMNYIKEGFADAGAYMEDSAKRDAIRQITEDILEQYQANTNCTEIIVFAHSQGTVVVYDVLTHNPQRTKCKTFIAIGSILSGIRQMYPCHAVFEKRLQKPLKWLFMYARYDPGPAGGLIEWFQPTPDSQDVAPEEILVDNRDTLPEDHVTYSVNRDQVVSRIVDEMFGPTTHHNPYYRDDPQRQVDFNQRRRRVARLALWRTVTYGVLLGVFGFFIWASTANATPTTSMLNGLITINGIKQTFGQSVKLLYRIPSGEDGSITFVPKGTSFVIEITDRNDSPQIVPRGLDRGKFKETAGGGSTYTTNESNLRTGVGNLVVWSAVFKHLVPPAFLAMHFGIVLLIIFRLYRDIFWKKFYEKWQKARHKQYKQWREQQP